MKIRAGSTDGARTKSIATPGKGTDGVRDIPPTPLAASINRIRIVDLPGVPIDPFVRGKQAYHLLSAPALVRCAQQHADALNLPEALRHGDPTLPRLRQAIPRHVDACLKSPDPAAAQAAETLARRLGRNLASILLTLHRGDLVNRDARPDWSGEAWARWRDIRHIRLGGGIVSGDLGDRMIAEARSALAAFGYGGRFTIIKSRYPRNMALIGAGRYVPCQRRKPSHQVALCLDMGQTSVKRAVVHVRAGEHHTQLAQFEGLPSEPVAWRWRNSPDAARDIDAEEVLDFVSRTIAEGYRSAVNTLSSSGLPRRALSPYVIISIAAYVRGGNLLGNGIYARMSRLQADVRPLIAERVGGTTGWSPTVRVIHDGTAAAALYAGTPHGAVIVVGTALGVGFPPASEEGLCKISPDLVVTLPDGDELTP